MKRVSFLILVGLIAVGFTSCDLFTNTVPDGEDPGTTGSDSINSVLSSLPDLKMKLPKSLSLDSTGSRKIGSRALNDVTDLNTSTVGSVKSQSWMDLQTGGNWLLPALNKTFDLLEGYAAENPIVDGKVFSYAITNAELANVMGISESDVPADLVLKNKFMEIGQDPKDFLLYATIYMKYSMRDEAGAIISEGVADILCKMRMMSPDSVSKKITMNMEVNLSWDGQKSSMRLYADIDAGSGDCTIVNANADGAGRIDTTNIGIMLTEAGSDGSITNSNIWRNNGNTDVYVAYGDDTAGGIASTYTSNEYDSYWSEYYDSYGDIILRANGQTNLWAPDITDATNLYAALGSPISAPETIYVRGKWNDETATTEYYVSKDKANWTQFIPEKNYWHAWYSRKGSEWAYGDAIYYFKNWEPGSGEYGSIYEFYSGFRVPVAELFNGKYYFMTNEYPLRNLLPITDTYKDSFSLKQKEGNTYTYPGWTDPDGVEHINSWTNYEYWLENLNATAPKPDTFDSADGDINLSDKLSQWDMYYWNAGEMTKVLGYFFRTTGSVPPYFSSPGTIVENVKTNLEEALKNGLAVDYTTYSNKVKESLVNDAVLATMAF